MHHLTCAISSLLHSINLILFTVLLVHLILRISPHHSPHLHSNHQMVCQVELSQYTVLYMNHQSQQPVEFPQHLPSLSYLTSLLTATQLTHKSTYCCTRRSTKVITVELLRHAETRYRRQQVPLSDSWQKSDSDKHWQGDVLFQLHTGAQAFCSWQLSMFSRWRHRENNAEHVLRAIIQS